MFEDIINTEFMPSYQRTLISQQAIINLSAEEYLLEVEITKEDDTLDVFILLVATNETKIPGSAYYFLIL